MAIAIGILLAAEELRASGGPWALLGELSLDGAVRHIPGVLPMVTTLKAVGHRRVCVPQANVAVARLVTGVEVVGVEGLDDVAQLVAGPRGRKAAAVRRRRPIRVASTDSDGSTTEPPTLTGVTELGDLRGREQARWRWR